LHNGLFQGCKKTFFYKKLNSLGVLGFILVLGFLGFRLKGKKGKGKGRQFV